MSKDGIKSYNGTMALLIQICAFQICTIALSLICGIINMNLLKGGIIWFYILGIVLNGAVLTIMLLGIFSNKTIDKILNLLIKVMKKAKVKNYKLKRKKLEESIGEYSKSSEYIKKNSNEFIKAIGRVFIQTIIFHSIPYFIYKSFGLNAMSYFKLFSMQSILFTTVSSIPLPGSIGVSETLFLKLYGVAFGTTLLSGAMLLYRFVSFYFYIGLFLIIVIINATKTKKIESEIDKNIEEVEKVYDANLKKLSYS